MFIEKIKRRNKFMKLKKYKDKNFYIKSESTNELENIFVKAFNAKDCKIRYEIIYDYMCFYLDKNVCSLCDFKEDKCVANRLNKTCNKNNGCCYFRKEGLCKYLENKECILPNISCKLFMCDYVEKKILKSKSLPKNYFLLSFFFNKKQRNILQRSYRKKKEEIINELLKNK